MNHINEQIDASQRFSNKLPIVWIAGGSGILGKAIAQELMASYNILNLSRKIGLPDSAQYKNYEIDLSKVETLEPQLQNLTDLYLPRALVFCQRYRPTEVNGFDPIVAMNTEILSVQKMIESVTCIAHRGPLSIAIVSSVNGYLINNSLPFWYHWLKSSQILLSKYYSTSKQHAAFNINCITPGTFLKYPLDVYPEKHRNFLSLLQKKNSRKGICNAQDIAYTVHYLISDQASCLNGQVITPDGGLTNKMQEACLQHDNE